MQLVIFFFQLANPFRTGAFQDNFQIIIVFDGFAGNHKALEILPKASMVFVSEKITMAILAMMQLLSFKFFFVYSLV